MTDILCHNAVAVVTRKKIYAVQKWRKFKLRRIEKVGRLS